MEKMRIGYVRDGEKPNEVIKKLLRCNSAWANMYDVDIFYFSPKRINEEQKTINGLFFDKSTGDFIEKITPYPHVTNNHSIILKNQYPHIYKELLQTSIFGYTGLGNKNKIYSVLREAGYSKYLIETHNYTDIDIYKQLDLSGKLILKPNAGCQGKNIYKLYKDSDFINVHFEHSSRKVSKDEFEAIYNPKFKRGIWLVQDYVESVTKEGNPFDIRINTRRGKDGAWTLRKMFARIGNSSGIVSNVHSGGSIGIVNNFLPAELGENWKKVYAELVKISKVLPDVMQKSYPTMLDDLGFDVGINRGKNNELKFFEVNIYTAPLLYNYEAYEAQFFYYMYLCQNYDRLLEEQRKAYGV